MNIVQSSKSLRTSIGAIIKNSEMLRFVPDHLKTKKMCKHVIKKLPFVTRYVPNQFKGQQMHDIIFLENGVMLKFVLNCYKNQKCVIKLLIIMLMH